MGFNFPLYASTEIEADEVRLPLHKLLSTIQQLPSRYRLIFNLYEMDGYTHKEIAKHLNISEGTSKSNLHRAKLILKEKIKCIHQSQPINTTINGK